MSISRNRAPALRAPSRSPLTVGDGFRIGFGIFLFQLALFLALFAIFMMAGFTIGNLGR